MSEYLRQREQSENLAVTHHAAVTATHHVLVSNSTQYVLIIARLFSSV